MLLSSGDRTESRGGISGSLEKSRFDHSNTSVGHVAKLDDRSIQLYTAAKLSLSSQHFYFQCSSDEVLRSCGEGRRPRRACPISYLRRLGCGLSLHHGACPSLPTYCPSFLDILPRLWTDVEVGSYFCLQTKPRWRR
jgi:hypothetical protein